MKHKPSMAPGGPGQPVSWNPGAKAGIGTALGEASLVWFSLGRGVLEEVYYPRVDSPCTRDLGLAVVNGHDFFSWEKDDTDSEATALEIGVPAYRLVNHCRHGRYRIEKTVFAHPDRPAVVQRIHFVPTSEEELQLFAVFNPHLGERASGWVDDYKGVPMLFAAGKGIGIAMACSVPFLERSAGFVGTSCGWRDLARHKRLTRTYDRAECGNVALTGRIDCRKGSDFVLALGFGLDSEAAGLSANAALLDGFDEPLARYCNRWQESQAAFLALAGNSERRRTVYRTSTAMMRTHQAKIPPGAAVASLSVPFGQARTGSIVGGYHLVWPRDLVETVGGLLAAGLPDHADATLSFLEATQELDGHWAQNLNVNGQPYWNGVQMDETALTIVLLDLARRYGVFEDAEARRFWPMVHRAAGYLVRNGPVTPEDRWEHDGGYSPFTLGAEIAALLIAAEMAGENGQPAQARYLRETADIWNAGIEQWTYVTGTQVAKRVGVDGYYVRLGQPAGKEGGPSDGSDPRDQSDQNSVSPDALALVRFGLRAANDPRIVNTIQVIDALLKVDLGYGPGWRRYTGDQYGEYPDGEAFDHKGGVGRAWPLFAGERGHYELAAGRPREAERMLQLMEDSATATGLIPEQVWDADDIPAKELFRGRPTTSACPLVWAQAEYTKLLRSLRDGKVFDLPPQTVERYQKERARSIHQSWRFNQKIHELWAGYSLRIELLAPAVVRWGTDHWRDPQELKTTDTGFGVHLADLPTERMPPGRNVVFTFRWIESGRWEGADFQVAVK